MTLDWKIWILLSAIFLALYDLAKKASVRENAVLPVLLCSTLFGSAAFLAALATTGKMTVLFAALTGREIALGLSKSVIVATSWVFTFCALRELPITIATPIRASAPALVILAAAVIYGERPSGGQTLGMILVLAGYWTFSWAGKAEGIDFRHNRAVYCAVAGAVFSAISALWDKCVFQVFAAPVEPIQLVFQLGLVAVYGAALLACRILPALRARGSGLRFDFRWTIPCVGILLAAADWLYFHGLAVPDTPISVAALLRRFSVVITFALGAVFFHERNLRRKGIALALVLSGVALLCT